MLKQLPHPLLSISLKKYAIIFIKLMKVQSCRSILHKGAFKISKMNVAALDHGSLYQKQTQY